MSWLLTMTLLVAGLMLLPGLYLGWRFKKATGFITPKTLLKWLPVLLLASFYLHPLAGLFRYLISGDSEFFNYPIFLTYWFWFGFVLSFQLITWVLLFDIIKIIADKASDWPSNRINTFYSYSLAALAAFLFVFTAVKMWVDTGQIDVKKSVLHSEQIPEAFNDFRIVHISDLQGDAYTGRKEIANYIQKVNALQPDLVIFTGDLISYGTDYIDMAAEKLSEAEATRGLYAVIGDHDYWAGVAHIKSAYQKYGVNLLQDENVIISFNGDSLLLTGITEVYSKHIPPDSLQKLTSAFKDVQFEILASHQATEKVVEAAREQNYELLLGGHTHGGQIRVPFMFMNISAPSFETPWLSGFYTLGDLLLNINNGLGFTLAPVRYDAQPSVSVIDLSVD